VARLLQQVLVLLVDAERGVAGHRSLAGQGYDVIDLFIRHVLAVAALRHEHVRVLQAETEIERHERRLFVVVQLLSDGGIRRYLHGRRDGAMGFEKAVVLLVRRPGVDVQTGAGRCMAHAGNHGRGFDHAAVRGQTPSAEAHPFVGCEGDNPDDNASNQQ
jgi:hypothetical protein